MTPVSQQETKNTSRYGWRPFIGVAILYIASHFLILFNRGFYWDGLYQSRMILDNRFDILWANLEPSRVYAYYFLLKLLSFSGSPVFLFKLSVFVSWLIAGTALYFVLRKRLGFSQNGAFFVTSSFLVIPAFLSRVELSVFVNSLSVMFFFLAVFIYFSAERIGASLARRAGFFVAGILFFLSFFTYSLLVFYAGFLLFLLVDAYKNRDFSVSVLSWGLGWFKSNLLLILLPLVFWAFKMSLGAPYGPAIDYNENSFIFMQPGFLSVFADGLWRSVTFGFWVVVNPASILQRRIFAVVFVCSTVLVFFVRKKLLTTEESEKGSDDLSERVVADPSPRWCIIAGSTLFFLGVLPYILVGKSPHVWGVLFATRHALLLPLGLSLILFGFIRLLIRAEWQFSVQAIFLGLFITFNIYNYWCFDMDWYQSRAITESLRTTNNQTILGASTLIFHDRFLSLRYMGRNMSSDNYRTYVYEAFPNNFKFAALSNDISTSSPKDDIRNQYETSKSWNILPFPEKFDPTVRPVHVILISRSLLRETMTVREWLKLKWYDLFADESTFLRVLSEDLRLEIIPIAHPELLFD